MKRSIWLLLVLNAGAFLWIWNTYRGDDSPQPLEIQLVELLGSPNRLTIQSGFPTATSLTLANNDSEWFLEAPARWPASRHAVSKLVNALRHIEARRIFTLDEIKENGETLADYGLDQPALTLLAESSAGSVTLAFGTATRDKRERYVLPSFPENDGKEIWAVKDSLRQAASLPVSEWMERKFIKPDVYDVRAVAIRATRGEALSLTRLRREPNGGWALTSPISSPADAKATELFLNELTSAHALRFVTDAAEAKALSTRLEAPALRLSVEGGSGGSALVVGEPIEGLEGARVRPAKVEGLPVVFLVDESFVSLLTNAESRLRDRRLLVFSPQSITSIEIHDSDDRLSLHKLEDGRWDALLLDGDDELTQRPGDEESINEFLRALLTLETLSFVTDAPSSDDLKTYGVAPPERTLVLKRNNGPKLTLHVGKYSESASGRYARGEQGGYVFTVDENLHGLLRPSILQFRQRLVERLPEGAEIRSIHLLDLDGNVTAQAMDANVTTSLAPILRHFRAGEILAEKYSEDGVLFRGEANPWRYELQTELALPDGNSEQNETRVYRFTERLGGRSWPAGSPSAGLTFLLPSEMIDALSVLLPADGNATTPTP